MQRANGVKVRGRHRGIGKGDKSNSWLPSILIGLVDTGVLEDGVYVLQKRTAENATYSLSRYNEQLGLKEHTNRRYHLDC